MKPLAPLRTSLLLLAITSCATTPLYAQAARSGGDNARALQQMQQLASERTALQADNAKLKDEVADLKKKLDKATSDGAAAAARTKNLQQESAQELESKKQMTESLEKSRGQMQELITHFRETAQNLKTVEVERNELKSQLDSRNREYATCVDRNVGLYDINRETLERLDKHGFWSGVRDAEPFTRLSRARLENLIDAYRYRIEELRVERQKKATAPASSPNGS
jgi:type I site-specific restriction endonuclease